MTTPPPFGLEPHTGTVIDTDHHRPIGQPPSLPCGCPLDGQCDGFHSIVDAWLETP